MATRFEIQRQIRFHLSQLAERNAHHDFERLCLEVALRLVSKNIVPMTGPVSSGGDQGRDFETFRSFFAGEPQTRRNVVGVAPIDRAAFACSLERTIAGKIKEDVRSISSASSASKALKVEYVYFFTPHGVPASVRHKLQAWARDQFAITLEIFDAEFLALHLSGQGLFFLAQQFLGIPSEIAPDPEAQEQDWYVEARDRWRQDRRTSFNLGDLADLRRAVRQATFVPQLRADLPMWCSALGRLRSSRAPAILKRQALYEIVVASLRGDGSLRGREPAVRQFFRPIRRLASYPDLEDASVLLMYVSGAVARNLVDLTPGNVTAWRDALAGRIDTLLQSARSASQQCNLLQIRGYLAALDPQPANRKPAASEILKYWEKIPKLLPKAPMFPVERFADQLAMFAPHLSHLPRFQVLVRRVDSLVTRRAGNSVAADKARLRAVSFYDAGFRLRALSELHLAKIRWYAQETESATIHACLWISQLYKELGLWLASKYYSLGAAWLAIHSREASTNALTPKAFLLAGAADYSGGAWIGYIGLTDMALVSQAAFTPAHESSDPDEVTKAVMHTVVMKGLGEKLCPVLLPVLDAATERWRIADLVAELEPVAREAWSRRGRDQVWAMCEEQLSWKPFHDVGPRRTVSWKQLGTVWVVAFANTYRVTSLAEGIVAQMQIFYADLAGLELCLLSTKVSVDLEVVEGAPLSIEDASSDGLTAFKVIVGTTDPTESIAVASAVLLATSLLGDEKYFRQIKSRARTGMSRNLFFPGSYRTLYRDLITEDAFGSEAREMTCPQISTREFRLEEHRDLGTSSGASPGYSKTRAHRLIRKRYVNTLPLVRVTLGRLLSDRLFVETAQKLRGSGWKDWHLLMAMASVVMNFRAHEQHGAGATPDQLRDYMGRFLETPEEESMSEVPRGLFSEENLRLHLRLTMVSTLKGMGLVVHQNPVDLEAVERFLRERYGYWDDDCPHNDPFRGVMGWAGTGLRGR